MAICTYFQRGMCRFGDNCKNEHISSSYRPESKINEIRLAVATESDTVLNGKQWILSCFAPFRDKLGLIIPEFIDDISPEEVRWECYQAKANGLLSQYTETLAKKIEEATRNMQLLKTGSAEVLNYLYELYNGNGNTNCNNPFHTSQGIVKSNMFTKSSFEKPQNIFGGAPSFGQPNMFQSSTQNNQLFQSSEQNIFQQVNKVQNLISQTLPQHENRFSTPVNNAFPPTSNAFIFPLQRSVEANTASGSTMFGQCENAFGITSNQNIINVSFGQTSGTNQPFGNTATSSVKEVFGQSADIVKMNSPFTQANNANNNAFGQYVVQPADNTSGAISTDTRTIHEQGAASDCKIFATNLLGNASSISTDTKSKNSDNVFITNTQNNDNPFIQAQQTKMGFFFNYDSNSDVFSEFKNLTDGDVAAFKATKFILGKIPTKPPPKEFCIAQFSLR